MAVSGAERASSPSSVARRLVVLVRADDARGFRLAGAEVQVPGAGEEVALLRALLADPTVGVIAAEEEVLGQVPPRVLQRARARGIPVLLAFSLPRNLGEAGRGREYVAALIRRAIGYAVRLAGSGGGRAQ
jgi:V/A-type H+-transporting ATPase subunit F